MGKKGVMPVYKTIDDYIINQSEAAQQILNEIRILVKETVLEVEEVSNSKAPCFKLVPSIKTNYQIMMAAYSGFVSFYPFPKIIEKYSDALKAYKQGKGFVQFPFNQPIPKELIVNMILDRKAELLDS